MELPEDEILLKLDRVMRHETTLHRQIDTSVKMLGRELPKLFEGRVREDLLRRLNETERTLKEDPYLDQWLTEETRKRSALPTAPPSLDLSALDTAPAEHNCQNEPAPALPDPPADPKNRDAGGPCDRGTREQGGGLLTPPELGAGGGLRLRPSASAPSARPANSSGSKIVKTNPSPLRSPLPEGEVSGLAHSEGSPDPPFAGGPYGAKVLLG